VRTPVGQHLCDPNKCMKLQFASAVVLSTLLFGCGKHTEPSSRAEPVTGIGIVLSMQEEQPTIMQVLPDSPAAHVGLSPGLVIQRIDGVPTAGKPLAELVPMLRGPEGSKTSIEVVDATMGKTNTVELTRKRVL
jgi:C-terminal processing protease CtpA/Prc